MNDHNRQQTQTTRPKTLPGTLHVDLAVIGAGAAGLSVAAGAVRLGFDVALIEKGEMGGECLNSGCVPSKALLAAAKAAHTMRTADTYGLPAASLGAGYDYRRVKTHIDTVIRGIAPHDSQERFEGMGVKVFRAAARLTGPNTLIAGDREIRARYIVIATGAGPAIPPITGLDSDKVLTNETVFTLTQQPGHLVILGGGAIGMELAQAYRRLGSQVTLLDAGPVLPRDDRTLAGTLRDVLRDEGVRIYESVTVESVEWRGDAPSVTIRQGADLFVIDGSHLLVAAGRQPRLDGLGLAEAGVDYESGGIKTDRRLRTSVRHIYAAGDVVAGAPRFTHAAGYEAGIIIRNMMFRLPAKADYSTLPWVTYTDPELAQVGLTEAQAREQYGDRIKISFWPLKDSDRGRIDKHVQGGVRLVMDPKGRLRGAAILAPQAGDMIGLWTLALGEKLKLSKIAGMIAPYPTYGEAGKQAAGAYFSDALFSGRTRFAIGLLQKLPF